jgi:hypothetical protein
MVRYSKADIVFLTEVRVSLQKNNPLILVVEGVYKT